MARILLVGYNPPALEKDAKVEAAHYRTWQFLDPLLADGHDVCLVANQLNGQSNATESVYDVYEPWSDQLTYHTVPFRRRVGWMGTLQKIHDTFDPTCIVAVNFDCSLCATRLKTDRPIWMDIYGDYLTIIQVARYRAGNDRGIQTSIDFMRQVLQRGDAYSVCGEPQAHALVGELAMAGRLNARSFAYQFDHVILPGAAQVQAPPQTDAKRTFLPSLGVPEDAFVVLWCGGYNTWTDVDTLFKALEWAMDRNERVHYVSVGASTYDGPDNVYDKLLQLIDRSANRDRFHMMGWRPWAEVADYYRESDVGLNIDAIHYETIFGTRTRLVEMLAASLPVITSRGCELADLIGDYGAGLVFDSGDWCGFGEHILRVVQDRPLHETLADKAHHYARHELSFAETTKSVRAWVQNPYHAPDRVTTGLVGKVKDWEYRMRALLRQAIWRTVGLER